MNHTLSFAVWLLNKKENRERAVERKVRYLKQLSGSPQDMASPVLAMVFRAYVIISVLILSERSTENKGLFNWTICLPLLLCL
jgi:hypothetical protein